MQRQAQAYRNIENAFQNLHFSGRHGKQFASDISDSDKEVPSCTRRCRLRPVGLRYHGVQDGAQVTTVGRAMGSDRRYVCRIRANAGRRSTAMPSQSLLGGDLVDPPHRGSLERFTTVLPLTNHLLAALAGMAGVGPLRCHVGSSVVAPGRLEASRLVASDRRRGFLSRKKGASASEKPSAARGLISWSWPMVTGSPSRRKSIAPAPLK